MAQLDSARDHVSEWMEKYQAAWASNRPEDIRALFTEDARYETRPNDPEAWQGADGIRPMAASFPAVLTAG